MGQQDQPVIVQQTGLLLSPSSSPRPFSLLSPSPSPSPAAPTLQQPPLPLPQLQPPFCFSPCPSGLQHHRYRPYTHAHRRSLTLPSFSTATAKPARLSVAIFNHDDNGNHGHGHGHVRSNGNNDGSCSPLSSSVGLSGEQTVPSFLPFSSSSTTTTTITAQLDKSHINSSVSLVFLSTPNHRHASRIRPLINSSMAAYSTSPVPRESPGSPPELTDSKSSKSSDFHSSGMDDSASCNLSHFEDISLEDLACPNGQYTTEKRFAASSPSFYPLNTQASRSLRDLTNTSRLPSSSAMRSQSGLLQKERFQLPLPARNTRKRSAPTSKPFLPLGAPPGPRSRSPSPSASPHNFCPSPLSLRTTSSSSGKSNFSGSSFQKTRRREAWSIGRKTVKELEDEYHDSDEELPEDAVIWNVPISPRAPHEREFTALAAPTTTSLSSLKPLDHGSERASPVSSTGPVHTETETGTNTNDNSKSPSLPSLPQSPNLSSEAGSDFSRLHNNRTWETAMSDLCTEARELTQALEIYAEESERQQEAQIQTGAVSIQRSSSSSHSVAVQLPPVRKNDPLIDPLPISKEKEKFLTRTRPSWLPPKNPREEKKHLKEYQKMMARAAEADRRRAKKMQKLQCEKDKTNVSLGKVWETHVLPNWTKALAEPGTRELWWKGVAPKRRGEIWLRAVGNDLGLTAATFETVLKRAKEASQRLDMLSLEERELDAVGRSFEQLSKDVQGVFAELKLFQAGGPLHQGLVDVCMAYAMYRVDLGYVSGVHSLAALLLLNLSPSAAFLALANILHRPLPAATLTHDVTALDQSYGLVLNTLGNKLPQLHAHLTSLSTASSSSSMASYTSSSLASNFASSSEDSNESAATSACRDNSVSPSTYLIPLFSSFLASNRIGVDIATRIWDIIVFEGDAALVRAAAAILGKLEGKLYSDRSEILKTLVSGETAWDLGNADEFIEWMREVGQARTE